MMRAPHKPRPAPSLPTKPVSSERPSMRLILKAFLLASAVSGLSFSAVRAETETPAAEVVLPAITVTKVVTRIVEDHVLASGLIAPVEQVAVVPLVEGQPIETLSADVGDTVAAGQVLAKLSTATLTLQQSQLTASLASAQSATTGTITGVSRFLKEKNPAIRIIGAQPSEGSRIPGIRKWPEAYLPSIYDPSVVDDLIASKAARIEQLLSPRSLPGMVRQLLERW